jgi:transcriptional regulator with XRE-family HTH domain
MAVHVVSDGSDPTDPETVLQVAGIGQALLIECKARKLSQAQASARFKVTKQTFNEWVNGKRAVPPAHAARVAKFLRVDVATVRELIERPRQDRVTVLEAKLATLEELMSELSSKVDALVSGKSDRHSRGQPS